MTAEHHFDLENESAYKAWREKKLAYYVKRSGGQDIQPITIVDYKYLSENEFDLIKNQVDQCNFALYRISHFPESQINVPISIARQLSLTHSDNNLCGTHTEGSELCVSEIKVTSATQKGEYVPYTNKAINWHTDGYYNALDNSIHSMILHCENSAMSGGENAFIDHEILYILLRDENPEFITALCHQETMIIPENRQAGELIRDVQSGPVFSFYPWGLHMRFTARTKSIIWRQDSITQKAVQKIRSIYNDDSIYKIQYRLNKGEGLVCNNILHMRNKFVNVDDDDKSNARLIYRMRFYQPLFGKEKFGKVKS